MNRIILLVLLFIISAFGGWMAVAWRGNQDFTLFAALFLCASSLIPVYLLTTYYGWKKACQSLVLLSLFAYGIERIGVATGFPYGQFHYLTGLGPLIGGVPWLLPFAWIPLMIGAWQLAIRITEGRISRILWAAAILVTLDLVLDPGAVALSLWKYQASGIYFGVPWTNFAGWVLSGSMGARLTHLSLPESRGPLIYWMVPLISTLGFWTAVCFRYGYTIPVLIGVSLFMVLLALARRDGHARLC